MVGPATGPGARSGAPARRRPRGAALAALVLGVVVLVLLGVTVLNVRANESHLFEPSLDELRSRPDEHGVTKDGYAASSRAIAEASRARDAVATALGDYYLALVAQDAEIQGVPELLAGLDQAAASTENLPALANPEVAALKEDYDEAQRAYRADLDELLADATALHEIAGCHPATLSTLDPLGADTLETLQQCRRSLDQVAGGSSPVADIAAASRHYLDQWIDGVTREDGDAVDDGRSNYLAAFAGTAQVGISRLNRMDEVLDGEGHDLTRYCDRASSVPAGS